MKRYNQGFGKFGPMEQCNSGEWMKYKDAEDVVHEWQEYCKVIEQDNKTMAEAVADYKMLTMCLVVLVFELAFVAIFI